MIIFQAMKAMRCFSFSSSSHGERNNDMRTAKSTPAHSSPFISTGQDDKKSGSEFTSHDNSDVSTESSTRTSFTCLNQRPSRNSNNNIIKFTFAELKSATRNFSRALIIGEETPLPPLKTIITPDDDRCERSLRDGLKRRLVDPVIGDNKCFNPVFLTRKSTNPLLIFNQFAPKTPNSQTPKLISSMAGTRRPAGVPIPAVETADRTELYRALETSVGSSFSSEALAPKPRPLVIVISGPSGVGKDCLIKCLREARENIHFGASTLRKILGDSAVFVFLVAESESELVMRLIDRRTESKEALLVRVATAREELKQMKNFDYVVVNAEGKLDSCVKMVESIIDAEKAKVVQRRVMV
ncbi:hypothetical protein E3N88_38201 [Mikania micrantha]|uniref:Guanylate kinase-like domain-containing protein n=1 Tax=Mikania micrantha TaxID=192012 RepID=A0A5N6LTB1_9ASTR|nr:hypothetical protein E3N88_38201 [Mikania micrantha]